VYCCRLRSLSHGGAAGSKSASQGLAPSASRRPKQACLNYSRDEMLTVYESCAELAVPDGLRALPDITVEKCQPPLASIPPSPEEQVAYYFISRLLSSSQCLYSQPLVHILKTVDEHLTFLTNAPNVNLLSLFSSNICFCLNSTCFRNGIVCFFG